jgi:site-specific DNA-methyltransferase (adenine-specific)
MSVQLHCGDCLSVMGGIPDASIDLILTDLPYGVTRCRWDQIIPLEPLWAQYKRIIKPRGAVVLTAIQPFTSMLVMSNRECFRYEWIWEKTVGTGFLDAKRKPLRCHESVCVFYGNQPTYHPQKWQGPINHSNGYGIGRYRDRSVYRGDFKVNRSDTSGLKYPRSVLRFGKHPSTERFHKTQKPVLLFEYMIHTYTNKDDTVLDSCMGSGTTGVACLNTGRAFIGIEKDTEIFATAEKRIAAELNKMPLLTGSLLTD